MSFRIEEKLFFKSENIFEFRKFLSKESAKTLYTKRVIKSLYFDNLKLDMYKDSIEGSVPRKKIRLRSYNSLFKDDIFLEKKISSVEGRFKSSEKIKNCKDILSKGYFDNIYGIVFQNLYVTYEREYAKINDVIL